MKGKLGILVNGGETVIAETKKYYPCIQIECQPRGGEKRIFASDYGAVA
jgi:hypothetical protein